MNDSTFENSLKIMEQVALDLNDGEEVLLHGKNKNWEAQTLSNTTKIVTRMKTVEFGRSIVKQVVRFKYCGYK